MSGTDIMTHSKLILHPDPSRTILRPFDPVAPTSFVVKDHPRAQRIADRILALDEERLGRELDRIILDLSERHRDLEEVLLRRFTEVNGVTIDCNAIRRDQAIVIGAYFCEEYSFEAAALFNPSIVLHPDQSEMPTGTIRFILATRHWRRTCFLDHLPDRHLGLGQRCDGRPTDDTAVVLRIEEAEGENKDSSVTRLHCGGSRDVSETVLFPVTPSQRQGIEDFFAWSALPRSMVPLFRISTPRACLPRCSERRLRANSWGG